MAFFNDKLIDGLLNGRYICSECGSAMEFEDEWEEVLVCSKCGHSVDLERYGFENDEDYDALYPSKEEVVGYEDEDENEDDSGETYDEVCGELDD
jgi:DNA-directed RNA polymerase subunit M/transcription elongation factor TFIIS